MISDILTAEWLRTDRRACVVHAVLASILVSNTPRSFIFLSCPCLWPERLSFNWSWPGCQAFIPRPIGQVYGLGNWLWYGNEV